MDSERLPFVSVVRLHRPTLSPCGVRDRLSLTIPTDGQHRAPRASRESPGPRLGAPEEPQEPGPQRPLGGRAVWPAGASGGRSVDRGRRPAVGRGRSFHFFMICCDRAEAEPLLPSDSEVNLLPATPVFPGFRVSPPSPPPHAGRQPSGAPWTRPPADSTSTRAPRLRAAQPHASTTSGQRPPRRLPGLHGPAVHPVFYGGAGVVLLVRRKMEFPSAATEEEAWRTQRP